MTEVVILVLNVVWSGILVGIVKSLLDRNQSHFDERLDGLDKASTAVGDRCNEIERDLLRLRAELPAQYVQREDWVRFGGTIDAKLDRLNDRLHRLD